MLLFCLFAAQVLLWPGFWGGELQWGGVSQNSISSGAAHAQWVSPNKSVWGLEVHVCRWFDPVFLWGCAPYNYLYCASIEATPPALHMARQVQGRLIPCWVHLLWDQGCMHWQSGTFLISSPPHTGTHPCWCMSVSLKSTVVSCMTCWTTEKGVCMCQWVCFVVLKELKNFWGGVKKMTIAIDQNQMNNANLLVTSSKWTCS